MAKQHKYDVKVQKQTVPKTVQFQPQVQHRVRGQRRLRSGYIDSFRKIIQERLFSKDKAKQSSSNKNTSKMTLKEKTITTSGFGEDKKIITPPSQLISQETKSINASSVLIGNNKSQSLQKVDKTHQTQLLHEQNQQSQSQYLQLLNRQYIKIKYIKKMFADCVLIGNENQLDLIQFKVQNKFPLQSKKWSLHLNKPIEGVTVSKLAQSKILLWTDKQLHLFQCNPKTISQPAKLIQKLLIESQHILSVQFVKRNIFLICCRSHIQIYQIMQINKDVTINKLDVKKFHCPQGFQVVEVPEHFGSNIKIFYANMREYDDGGQDTVDKQWSKQKPKNNKQKQQQPPSSSALITTKASNKKKDVFGLYYIQIEYNFTKTIIHEMKKIYQIKKSLRQQIKLFNISSSIFFMNLTSQVLAVKNGLIIDNVGVNFQFDHCYLKIIQGDMLVHILTDKIEFYRLELNYDVMPERIKVTPFDSIYFPRNLSDEFLSIVSVGNGYGIFFQHQMKREQQLQQLMRGQISYWYGLTYPIPLYEKLNEIFPTTQNIQMTSFETLQGLCDMAGKMGLTTSQAYRYLWKKSKKQTQKDYQILLSSRDYTIIQQQIITLLKKRGQKWRIINKNQQICLEFLRPRVFDCNASLQALQEFTYCHFFNLKLKAFKDLQVERRRFELEMYNKGREASLDAVNKLMDMFQVRELKAEDKESNQQRRNLPTTIRLSYQQQQSQILSQDFNYCTSKDLLQSQQQEQQLANPIHPLPPLPSHQQINLFQTFLKTSKNFQQIQQDRKNAEVRQKQKMRHQLQQKMKQADYNQIKVYIRDYYFYRDTSLKHFFLQTIHQLMSKEHTINDHLKYYTVRVLIRNFKILFRSIYEELLLQLIQTYKHKISRLIEHFIELLPYEYNSNQLPQNTTDESLCQCIWNPIQSQQLQQCLFVADITTIQNKQVIVKFKESLWYKRGYLAHHGVVSFTKQQIKHKYSVQNMKQIQQHYFYLFISKFLQIKILLNKQLHQIQSLNKNTVSQNAINFHSSPKNSHNITQLNQQKHIQKKVQQTITRVNKQLTRTNELLKRVEQIYPLMPQHLKGYINLYFDLYNYLQTFKIQQKQYNSIYQFLMLRDFELFRIYFVIQKKSKGFLLKHILQKYQDPSLVQNGRQKFISGIEHYFDSEKSQITDLKTIFNRLNGQSRQFHIQFQSLYDCLLSAMMKKIRVTPSVEIKLDELLIYVQNIPFSASNGRIFEKLLLIQEVHLEMELLKRSKINMSILEIRDNAQIVISALVEAQLRANKLILDDGVKEFTTDFKNQEKDSQKSQKMLQLRKNSHHDFSLSTVKDEKITNNTLPQQISIQLTTQRSKQLMTGIISSLSKLSLTRIQSVSQLKMYFWKCISQLQCIKRHLYGNQFQHLLGFVFITELLQQEYLISFVGQALQDEDIKEMLELNTFEDEKLLRKSIVYYSYKQRLAKYNESYLGSESYLNCLLTYLPYSDSQRLLIQQEIRYCHLFKQCEYDIPYPLSVIGQIPVLDEIEYHISQINSQKIDQLDVEKLFNSMENMRQLVQPSISLTQKSLSERVKQFQRVLYQFVFFKYLREKKLLLALQMIGKLILLYPKQNAIIYCVFIIDSMLGQFNDSTGDLLIKLVSYYFDHAQSLRILLHELITKPFTTTQFEKYLKEQIQSKIKTKTYKYFNHNNNIFSQQIKQFAQKVSPPQQRNTHPQKQEQFLKLCELFDTVYHHVSKSSQYIQRNKYFQLLYRLMLFNPYQVAYFIYNKPQINLKAIRGFFSFISQEILFNPQIVIKIGSILFIIILNRIRDHFMISQQIKQYEKLNLVFQTFDQNQFLAKFSDSSTLTKTQSLVYESYLTMKKKLECFQEHNINQKVQKQLCRVKQIYDKDTFLVNKHNIMATRKHGNISYLSYDKWISLDSKLEYYLNNIEEFASYKAYTYQYATVDKDESYVTKGQDEFNCPKVTSWPNHVQFNKIKNRHQILIRKKNTRIPICQKYNQVMSNVLNIQSNSKRDRKSSAYLPEEFKLHKKSTTDLQKHSNFKENNENHIKHAQSSPLPRDSGNFLQVESPNNKLENLLKTQRNPTSTQKNYNNPILNFLNMGASFGGFGQFKNMQ